MVLLSSRFESGDRMRLGELEVAPLGVGAWAWGTGVTWGYGREYGDEEIAEAFRASTGAGVTVFDTAEVYGSGRSERILGRLVRRSQKPVVVASKFAPLPYRLSARSLLRAVEKSRERLGVEVIDLYQIHFPSPILKVDSLMDALAEAVKRGWVREVGVSNYGAHQMMQAARRLETHDLRLAANQVRYSLLHREPERDGVLDACREFGIALIAYSPIAQGLLTGKYRPGVRPAGGLRRLDGKFRSGNLRRLEPVIDLLRRTGEAHGDAEGYKTPSQVALNWLISRGSVMPIPGAKDRGQALENAGSLGWRMAEEEFDALDRATREV